MAVGSTEEGACTQNGQVTAFETVSNVGQVTSEAESTEETNDVANQTKNASYATETSSEAKSSQSSIPEQTTESSPVTTPVIQNKGSSKPNEQAAVTHQKRTHSLVKTNGALQAFEALQIPGKTSNLQATTDEKSEHGSSQVVQISKAVSGHQNQTTYVSAEAAASTSEVSSILKKQKINVYATTAETEKIIADDEFTSSTR